MDINEDETEPNSLQNQFIFDGDCNYYLLQVFIHSLKIDIHNQSSCQTNSAFSVDVHQIGQSKAFCVQHPKLCGNKQVNCECITDGFGKVPVLDFFSVICGLFIWIIFIACSDSKKNKKEKKIQKTKVRTGKTADLKPPLYEKEDSVLVNDANECYSEVSKGDSFHLDASGRCGNFQDEEKENSIEYEPEIIVKDDVYGNEQDNGTGGAYD